MLYMLNMFQYDASIGKRIHASSQLSYFFKIGIHLDGVYGLEGHDGVARVDGTDKGVGVLHADYVGYWGHVQLSGKPGKFVE